MLKGIAAIIRALVVFTFVLVIALSLVYAMRDKLNFQFSPKIEMPVMALPTVEPTQAPQPTAVPAPPQVIVVQAPQSESDKAGVEAVRQYGQLVDWVIANNPRQQQQTGNVFLYIAFVLLVIVACLMGFLAFQYGKWKARQQTQWQEDEMPPVRIGEPRVRNGVALKPGYKWQQLQNGKYTQIPARSANPPNPPSLPPGGNR